MVVNPPILASLENEKACSWKCMSPQQTEVWLHLFNERELGNAQHLEQTSTGL